MQFQLLKIALWAVRNIGFGQNEGSPWNSNHSFIRCAAGRRRQIARFVGDVGADHGEITVIEFPNVRAAMAASRFCAIGVRVRADSL